MHFSNDSGAQGTCKPACCCLPHSQLWGNEQLHGLVTARTLPPCPGTCAGTEVQPCPGACAKGRTNTAASLCCKSHLHLCWAFWLEINHCFKEQAAQFESSFPVLPLCCPGTTNWTAIALLCSCCGQPFEALQAHTACSVQANAASTFVNQESMCRQGFPFAFWDWMEFFY